MSNLFVRLCLVLCILKGVYGQNPKSKKEAKPDTSQQVVKPGKKKSFDDSLKNCIKFDGLFIFYQDTLNGTLQMAVRKSQLHKEYIYFVYSENGLTSANAFRGSFRDNRVIYLKKNYNKIEIWALNTGFYFDPKSQLSKVSDANINHSLLASVKISDYDPAKEMYLLQVDEIFLGEILHRIKPNIPRGVSPDNYYTLGTINRSKSKYIKIRSYPKNSDVVAEYVFENTHPTASAGAEVADDRYVSITIQHTFVAMPENNFKPRFDDPRVGYFHTSVTDMTSASPTPYRDVIHRWHLEKKDSSLAISEPKEPIVWWLEKSTPLEWRNIIREAVLQWNVAFEKAGFKNALQVYVQPDTATWDAGDIRYHVIRWASSPGPIFGGYGPSFVNPRTGQILGADIMLEYIFLTNRLRFQSVFLPNTEEHVYKHPNCMAADNLHNAWLFGSLVPHNQAVKSATDTTSVFMKQAMYYLILHEIGHTLGLQHNMRASHWLTPEQLKNVTVLTATGITASVMDYPAVCIDPAWKKDGVYFNTKVGPYDEWAIRYGYTPYTDSTTEALGLQALLLQSTKPEFAFGNDADDMRTPGLHIDPRVMINDLSADPIAYMTGRMQLCQTVVSSLLDRYKNRNQSYQEFKNAYMVITTEISNCLASISRYVAGVYVDRSFASQKSGQKPYTPVPLRDQKRAFEAISTWAFSPKAFQSDAKIYAYLQSQRRGFGFMQINEDPKIHERVLGLQKVVLDHWLHPSVLKRMVDTELYGNQYTLDKFLSDLTKAIFVEDLTGQPHTFRMQLQVEYVQRLISASKSENLMYDAISKAQMQHELRKIERMMLQHLTGTERTLAHRNYLITQIQKSLSAK